MHIHHPFHYLHRGGLGRCDSSCAITRTKNANLTEWPPPQFRQGYSLIRLGLGCASYCWRCLIYY
jgi:hypothetical protein